MCPFCIGSTALLAGSVFSAGGLASAVVNKLRSKSSDQARPESDSGQPEAKSRQEVLDTFSRSLESAKDALKRKSICLFR